MGLQNIHNMYGVGSAQIDGQAPTADVELVAAKEGYYIVVDSFEISVGGAAATCFFESGTATKISPTYYLPQNGSVVQPSCRIKTAKSAALTFTSVGATSTASVRVNYHYEQ